MTAGRRTRAFLAFVWLALATILAPALAPVGSALEPSSGSAFNPFTSEVSLGPSRSTPVAKKAVANAASDGKAGGHGRTEAPATLASAIAVRCPPDPVAANFLSRSSVHAQCLAPGAFRARAPPSA